MRQPAWYSDFHFLTYSSICGFGSLTYPDSGTLSLSTIEKSNASLAASGSMSAPFTLWARIWSSAMRTAVSAFAVARTRLPPWRMMSRLDGLSYRAA